MKTLLLFLGMLISIRLGADAGPKPTRSFVLEYATEEKPELYKGYFIECMDATCEKWDTLEEKGPQGFFCTESGCEAVAYGFAPYARIILRFSDTILVSNVFKAKGFRSTYKVEIRDTELLVTETTSFWAAEDKAASYFKYLLFNLIIELAFAIYFFRKWQVPMKNLQWIALANVISLAILQFIVLHFAPTFLGLVLGEILVILLEAVTYQLLIREPLTMRRSLTLSALSNVVSFFVGIVIFYFLSRFY